jgi:monoamine oxidase
VPLTDAQLHSERLRSPDRVRDPNVSKQPAAVLLAYMWGDNARRFASLLKEERDAVIIRCLESVYPGAREELIGDPVHYSWDAQTNPDGGAFAWYQPGQQTRYQEAAMRPHPDSSPGAAKIFFAGEHLGLIQGWVQSAMVTALDAVLRTCGVQRV